MRLGCVLRWHSQPPVPFLVLHRVRAGRPAIHGYRNHSRVPFLVLHRVWAGEGNFEKQSPVPFLVPRPAHRRAERSPWAAAERDTAKGALEDPAGALRTTPRLVKRRWLTVFAMGILACPGSFCKAGTCLYPTLGRSSASRSGPFRPPLTSMLGATAHAIFFKGQNTSRCDICTILHTRNQSFSCISLRVRRPRPSACCFSHPSSSEPYKTPPLAAHGSAKIRSFFPSSWVTTLNGSYSHN